MRRNGKKNRRKKNYIGKHLFIKKNKHFILQVLHLRQFECIFLNIVLYFH